MSSLRDRYHSSVLETGKPSRQTLKTAISCVGRGLHSGLEVSLRLLPAPVGTGVMFRRTDLDAKVPARFDYVSDTKLCTVVSLPEDPRVAVGTVEHLMAAISACQIDDIIIEVDAPELPVLDGSAAPYMFLIESAGIVSHGGVRETIEILRTVQVRKGEAFAELRPHEQKFPSIGLELSVGIEFAAPAIGVQHFSCQLNHDDFATQLAAARTFTMASEIAALRQAGLAKGGSLANAIVVDGEKILNPEGLRWADEFVRHKMLDVVGDLALAGVALSGRFIGHCSGHALNNLLLRELFSSPDNYRVLQAPETEMLEMISAAA